MLGIALQPLYFTLVLCDSMHAWIIQALRDQWGVKPNAWRMEKLSHGYGVLACMDIQYHTI